MHVAMAYTVIIILYTATLPAEAVAATARSRIKRYPLPTSCAYLSLGALSALQPLTTVHGAAWGQLSRFVALLTVRLVQLCLCDVEPLGLLGLCAKVRRRIQHERRRP